MLSVGSQAPDFDLMGSDGKEHTLAEFKGKSIILYFYPKDDTAGCTIEAKEFNKSMEEMERKGAVIIGVSKDDLKSHEKFKSKYSLGFLLLSDPDSKVIKAYDSYGNKGIFGMGTLRRTFIIDGSGKITKIFDNVKPLGHANEVSACLG